MATAAASTIRWGILGCGAVTEVKSGPAFQKTEGSALNAVMRRRGDLAADYARRHGVPSWTDDAGTLIADPTVDAVYVAAPPGAHESLALAVCAARKPAYVEKPMARNHAECQRMIAAFAAAGVPLFVAYYRRALPRFVRARDLVAAGELGTITGVSYRLSGPYHRDVVARRQDGTALPWRLDAEHAGGGLLLDLGCHTLDILDFICGPLGDVRGAAANLGTPSDVEDTVALTFRTADGALGTAQWLFAAAERADDIVVSGDRAELRLSTFGNEPVELRRGDRVDRFDLPNPPHIQQPMIQSIVDELRGRGTCASTGVSAARTSAIIDAVLVDYYGTRDDGFWRTPEDWPGNRARTRPGPR
jgi:predicted dehydrogenase